MLESIENLDDVAAFSKELIGEGINFHPDDDFENYVNTDSGEPSFSAEQAALRNKLMQQAFEVCESNNVDIYDFTMEIYLKETGLDKYIPLPSSVN